MYDKQADLCVSYLSEMRVHVFVCPTGLSVFTNTCVPDKRICACVCVGYKYFASGTHMSVGRPSINDTLLARDR